MGPELYSLTQASGLIVTAFLTALAALLVMSAQPRRSPRAQMPDQPDVAFLFDGEALVDATDAAQRLLGLTEPCGPDLIRLVSFLSPRFPDLYDTVMSCNERDKVQMTSSDGKSHLRLQVGQNRLRLSLAEVDRSAVLPIPDRHSLTVLTEELAMHRAIGNGTPFPVWRQSPEGRIIWANAEYRALAGKLGAWDADTLTPPRIFKTAPVAGNDTACIQRTRLELPNEKEPRWYEYQINSIGTDMLVAAMPVDRVVRAERSLHDFVQTLSQTFAHLNVGLAVFSRNRELAIFNPALTELLELSPEFLITRPTLFQVFDKLREHQLLPEPKNYKSWRQQMSELEAAAADGVHSETWALVDGRTYRVTGRPHPEGAVAFLFEDISAEISLQRKFKSDLQLGQAVVDSLEEAIAVFSPSGEMTMHNRAYAMLWQLNSVTDGGRATFLESSRKWQTASVPTPIWGDARDFAATIGERSNWSSEIRLREGRRLTCRFDALPGGCTLVGFSTVQDVARPQIPAVRESANA